MLFALSSSQKLAIVLVAGAFVVFALVSAMLIPRSRPDFPGRHVGWFVAVSALFTVAMLATIIVVAKETGEEEATAAETHTTPTGTRPTPTEPQTTEATTTGTTTTEATTTEATTTEATTTEAAPAGDAAAGKVVFTTNCGGCHTLADAGTSGTVGPNLDSASPSYDKVVERVTNGKAPMPPFQGVLTDQQIQDVAAYVSSAAGS